MEEILAPSFAREGYFAIISSLEKGEKWKQWQILFSWLQNHCCWGLQPWNEKVFTPWKESYDKARQRIKKQRHHFANRSLYSQTYGFSSSHGQMWELDHKEGWALKNWCFQIVSLGLLLIWVLSFKRKFFLSSVNSCFTWSCFYVLFVLKISHYNWKIHISSCLKIFILVRGIVFCGCFMVRIFISWNIWFLFSVFLYY